MNTNDQLTHYTQRLAALQKTIAELQKEMTLVIEKITDLQKQSEKDASYLYSHHDNDYHSDWDKLYCG